MITEKSDAIKAVNQVDVDFDQIDKRLLRDKDVALAYMQYHSSNEILVREFPIDIDVKGMIDDAEFILNVIKNLDVGYNKQSLMSLLKYSTSCIVKRKMDKGDLTDENELKDLIATTLQQFNDNVKVRGKELERKQSLLAELNEFIDKAEMDAFEGIRTKTKAEKYKRCNIGFTAEL